MDAETGIGTWSYEDFYKALKEGKAGWKSIKISHVAFR